MKNFLSEFAGTFGFVFIGCGAAVFATPFIGYPGVALAFGLGYGAMLCAFKDGSFNPAVTLAALSCDRNGISWKSALLNAAGNIAAQIAGAFAAVWLVYFVYAGKTGYVYQGSSDANIIERYAPSAAFVLETVLNLLFLLVFFKSGKDRRAAATAAVITAGYLLSYPVTRGAMNPARTSASAIIEGEDAVSQLPLFWGASLTAAIIAGIVLNPAIIRFINKKSGK